MYYYRLATHRLEFAVITHFSRETRTSLKVAQSSVIVTQNTYYITHCHEVKRIESNTV